MLDKDKLFFALLIYLNVGSIDDADVSEYLMRFAESFKYDESIERLIIPIRKGETRVECINPVLLTDKQYEDVREKIKNLTKKVENVLNSLKNDGF